MREENSTDLSGQSASDHATQSLFQEFEEAFERYRGRQLLASSRLLIPLEVPVVIRRARLLKLFSQAYHGNSRPDRDALMEAVIFRDPEQEGRSSSVQLGMGWVRACRRYPGC